MELHLLSFLVSFQSKLLSLRLPAIKFHVSEVPHNHMDCCLCGSVCLWKLMYVTLFAAGEFLYVAEQFLDKRFHPTVICRGTIEC